MAALQSIKNQAFRIVFWQLMIIMGLAIVLFLLRGIQTGLSALLGGAAYWLPTLVFVWRMFTRPNVRAAKEFVVTFFAGETIKLFGSAILFLLIAKYLPVNVLSLLFGYVSAIIAFWIASVFFLSRHQGVGL